MRTSILAGLAALGVASVAHADDTKPPQISDVKAAAKGGQVQVEARITDETGVLSAVCYHRAPGEKAQASPMTKSDLDDTFRVTFAGGPENEYWIEASDLLGNGPATWGSSSKAYAVGGKAAPGKPVANAEPPAPKKEPKRARKTPAPARTSHPGAGAGGAANRRWRDAGSGGGALARQRCPGPDDRLGQGRDRWLGRLQGRAAAAGRRRGLLPDRGLRRGGNALRCGHREQAEMARHGGSVAAGRRPAVAAGRGEHQGASVAAGMSAPAH